MVYRWVPLALDSLRGIEPHEVHQTLGAKRRLPVPGVSGGVRVLAVFGRTHAGRLLMVLIHLGDDFDHHITGARDATPDESIMFVAWEASGDD